MANVIFPRDVLTNILKYPGNQKCCDCTCSNIEWANINHGTLHCLDCAGKHRHFGVKVSFIRSLYMDTWSLNQIEAMKQGMCIVSNKSNLYSVCTNILGTLYTYIYTIQLY